MTADFIMKNKSIQKSGSKGFTLVELMIAVAILSVVVAIAIPAYNGFVLEARLGAGRANLDSLRLFLEDYRLDEGIYVGPSGNSLNTGQIMSDFGWNPDDNDAYTYTATLTNTTYNIVAYGPSGTWVRYERSATNSSWCDSDTTGATNTACP